MEIGLGALIWAFKRSGLVFWGYRVYRRSLGILFNEMLSLLAV